MAQNSSTHYQANLRFACAKFERKLKLLILHEAYIYFFIGG